jgi:patatin-like phospholipase/acyl hydrolase
MGNKKFSVLALDGGGSKGVYTVGILKELELKLGGKLYEHFDLIYGTSTGSIIASLIALGTDIPTIEKTYLELIPKIMCGSSKEERSAHLKKQADTIFSDKKFDSFKTLIGIVALNYDKQAPLVFKTNLEQAHGMKQSFLPGFGCTISDAVQASCAAYPIFSMKQVHTENQGTINAVDGGFIANNPTLFSLIDAHKAVGSQEEDLRILSIGTGRFIEKPLNWKARILKRFKMTQFIERVFTANTVSNEVLTKLLYPNLHIVRINDTFTEPEYGTNMVEIKESKLKKMIQLGRDSYASHEKEILQLFNPSK